MIANLKVGLPAGVIDFIFNFPPGLEPQLGALSAAYVLFLAILGPILARVIEPILRGLRKEPAE